MTKDTRKDKGGKKPGKRELSGDDRSLWDFVTRSVRPLMGREPPPHLPISEENPKVPAAPHWSPDFELKLPARSAEPIPDTGGIDRRTSERLRKGQMEIEGVLDLHGLHQGPAQDRLTRFLIDSQNAGRRCVLVITGKGSISGETGVLRRMVPVWLAMMPLAPIILSHAPAKPKDGGSGAIYILLRRQR